MQRSFKKKSNLCKEVARCPINPFHFVEGAMAMTNAMIGLVVAIASAKVIVAIARAKVTVAVAMVERKR